MIERILLVIVLFVVGRLVYGVYTKRKIAQISTLASADPVLTGLKSGVATVVYFTSVSCAPCNAVVTPALERLQNEFQDRVQIVKIDAVENQNDAQRWGVISIPTMFILNKRNDAIQINHGVVNEETLRAQILTAQTS